MNVLYGLDNNFVPQTATSMMSLCLNNKKAKKINFYLFSCGVSEENKNKLKKMVKKQKRNIEFIEINNIEEHFNFKFDVTGWPKVTLSRLLMDKLLPKNIDKILYIDGDTIVRGSIETLWNTKMDNSIIAASIEPTVSKERKERLQMLNYPYCNAGVMLINLKLWRQINATQLIFDFYKKFNGNLFACDQDAINGSLKEYVKIISPKYNYFNVFDQYPYYFLRRNVKPAKYISKKKFREARKNPVIIHYLGEERPWRLGNKHRFRKDFYNYLNQTEWHDMKFEQGWNLYFKCWNIFNLFMKPFPYLRLKIINSLIPTFLKLRSKKK